MTGMHYSVNGKNHLDQFLCGRGSHCHSILLPRNPLSPDRVSHKVPATFCGLHTINPLENQSPAHQG